MSYILDALRKAQREQQRGQAPDVGAAVRSGADVPRRRRIWAWAVAAVLGMNGLVLSWLVWPRPPAQVLPTAVPGPDAAVVVAPAEPRRAREYVVSPPARPGEDSARAAVQEPAAVPLTPRAEPRPLAQEARPRRSRQERASPKLPAPAPVRPDGVTPPAPAVEAPPVQAALAQREAGDAGAPAHSAALPAQLRVDAPAPALPPAEPSRPAEPGPVPRIQDLPVEVRQGLPALEINGHVYAEDPGQRFVFINWKGYREGERVGGPAGPLLERVTPEGVVLDFGSVRARVPLLP